MQHTTKELKQSETVVIKRSQINFAPYNPKNHSKEAIRQQKKNFKQVGFLGGIVWNEVTGNLVSGHKRIMAMDEHFSYDGENDYEVKVEKVSMDEKTEMEQNIYMDANSTNTEQNYDLLAKMIPDIDYKNAGLTAEDLSLMGLDYSLQTEEEVDIANDLMSLSEPIEKNREAERDAIREKKQGVRDKAEENAKNLDSYVMVNFDTWQAKANFMERFDLNPQDKFIKGEHLVLMIDELN